jgi:hypothetical protein
LFVANENCVADQLGFEVRDQSLAFGRTASTTAARTVVRPPPRRGVRMACAAILLWGAGPLVGGVLLPMCGSG